MTRVDLFLSLPSNIYQVLSCKQWSLLSKEDTATKVFSKEKNFTCKVELQESSGFRRIGLPNVIYNRHLKENHHKMTKFTVTMFIMGNKNSLHECYNPSKNVSYIQISTKVNIKLLKTIKFMSGASDLQERLKISFIVYTRTR